jgi:hypothetical protein
MKRRFILLEERLSQRADLASVGRQSDRCAYAIVLSSEIVISYIRQRHIVVIELKMWEWASLFQSISLLSMFLTLYKKLQVSFGQA